MIEKISVTFPASFSDETLQEESREINLIDIALDPEETETDVIFLAVEQHLDIAAGVLAANQMNLQISIQTNTIMIFPAPVFGGRDV